MATDETDGLADENRDEATEDGVAISERTVKTEYISLAELRCGITLQDDIEADEGRQSSSSDARFE